jgi:glycosyltransferase involved in cell wall biosynthesis
MPLVSICIPTYNGGQYLAECIESALAQSFGDIEVLVVDDCSSDNTVPIAHSYAGRDPRVRVSQNGSNLGLVDNWNHSVRLAQGEWVKFLHQDDRLVVDCVEQMLAVAKPGVDLVAVRRQFLLNQETTDDLEHLFGRYISEHDIARHFPGKGYISAEEFAQLVLRAPDGNCIGEPTATMVRRCAFEKFGFFNRELVLLCDWEYWARVAVNTGLCYVDRPLAYFRVHADSASAHIREAKRFRGLRLDPLIILYELTYSPHYSRVRLIAKGQEPPVRLRDRLSDAVRATRFEAASADDAGEALSQWWKVLRRHPRLLAVSPGYVIRFLRQKCGSEKHSPRC